MAHRQQTPVCGAKALFAALNDPTVDRIHLELDVTSNMELHAELVKLWIFCISQLHGSSTLSSEMLTAASSAKVCSMMTKIGVVCHINGIPPAPPQDPLAVFNSTCVAQSGTHTIAFSLARQFDARACRTMSQ
jgi:hypothetical protein